jgi:hypothetical protein
MKGETKRGIVLAWTLEAKLGLCFSAVKPPPSRSSTYVCYATAVVYVLDSVPRRKQRKTL